MEVQEYIVTYYRPDADVYDCRTFCTLKHMYDWFRQQNEIERTVIVEITKGGMLKLRKW